MAFNIREDGAGLITNAATWTGDFVEGTVDTLGGIGRNGLDGSDVPDGSLSQSKYTFDKLIFPSDLGSENNGHYLIFNINVPVRAANGGGVEQRGAYRFDEVLPGDFSKVDVLRFGGFPGYGGASRQLASVPRYTRRIAKSIALHMPTPMIYDTSHEFENISLTAIGGEILTGALKGAGQFASGILNGVPGGGFVGDLVSAAGTIASPLLNNIQRLSRIAGKPVNPLLEVLFTHTHLRQYDFEFLMVPRNKAEADAINLIIKNFRFYSAPEIDPYMSLFFIPPAEFDITIYNKGRENQYIPRINTSVLKRIQVNYVPFNEVFTTYGDGSPVGVLLTMTFLELEVLHKQRVLQGF